MIASLIASAILSCHAHGALPDKLCTPGAIFLTETAQVICKQGWTTKDVRNVPSSEKRKVLRMYGIKDYGAGKYEIDHLISLELGGSNDITNLWPELASPTPGFHEKDKVENDLHRKVCSGQMTLDQAQKIISINWLEDWNPKSR
jgi:hypothetical protein